jgi:putative membrane-bound dehydrogenase-like protein
MRAASLLAVLALPLVASAQPTHQVKLNGHTFTLPQGFTIEVAVSSDLAPRPIAAAFDEKGRLYVTDSSGSNAKVAEQLKEKLHRILRLESTKGDGVFDKQTVFVKNVMFPEGCMWLNDSLYVAAPPHILKFTDTNDDGVADKEEVWFDGKTLTGCANDLHGPYRGPDGYVYWTKGAFAKQEYTEPMYGKKVTTRAAHIFRALPNARHVEPVMTGGMDNPVDVVFTPGGDIIFSTTFFQHPANGKRDGLVHAVYGAVYGKDHDVVHEHPWAAPQLMPPMTHMGPAAPCGLHRYESDQFGPAYANNIFCCQFNLRKVSRHILMPKGSTYETKDSDFVASDNLDFHPTDVIEDADGSLLIVDTGGWYKLCCPTSQLVKPDVTGAVYRVRKAGAHKVDDPRGLKIAWAKLDETDLGKLLHDPRPAVRQRVVDEVRFSTAPYLERKWAEDVAVAGLMAGNTEHGVISALWLLCRNEDGGAMTIAAALTRDRREEVRLAAMHVLAVRGLFYREGASAAVRGLKDPSPRVRRVAADALGRMREAVGSRKDVFAALADETNDQALDRALTFALSLDLNNVSFTREGLAHDSPRVRRAGLVALETNSAARLDATEVLPHLGAKDAALRDTAWWIAGRHPEWGADLAAYFQDRFKGFEKLVVAEQDELVGRAVPFLKTEAVRKAVGDALAATAVAPRPILRGMARSGLKQLPDEWTDGLRLALSTGGPDVVRDAVLVLRAVPPTAAQFDALAQGASKYRERLKSPLSKDLAYALQAAGPAGRELAPEAAAAVIGDLHRDRPGAVRNAAADWLGRAALPDPVLVELAGMLKYVSPLELPKVLAVFEKSKAEAVGLALAKALRDPAVRPAVRLELVKPILDKYPAAVKSDAEKLYAELAEARKGETERLDQLLKEMKPGDVRRGQVVFNSAKTNCIACHKMGYVGGAAGPDLTRIGGIRTERDLLEAVLYPSASFVRSYEPYRVVTKDDRTLNGVLKKDAPDEIVIAVAADREERIARSNIESITPSTVSLMPAGLEQQLSPQELADLIAFLRASK